MPEYAKSVSHLTDASQLLKCIYVRVCVRYSLWSDHLLDSQLPISSLLLLSLELHIYGSLGIGGTSHFTYTHQEGGTQPSHDNLYSFTAGWTRSTNEKSLLICLHPTQESNPRSLGCEVSMLTTASRCVCVCVPDIRFLVISGKNLRDM